MGRRGHPLGSEEKAAKNLYWQMRGYRLNLRFANLPAEEKERENERLVFSDMLQEQRGMKLEESEREAARLVLANLLEAHGLRKQASLLRSTPAKVFEGTLLGQKLERTVVGGGTTAHRMVTPRRKATKKVLLVEVSRRSGVEEWVAIEEGGVFGDFAWRDRPWLVSVGSGYSVWRYLVFARDENEAVEWAADARPHLVYLEADEDDEDAEYVEALGGMGRLNDQLGVQRVRTVRSARETGLREGVFSDGTRVEWNR